MSLPNVILSDQRERRIPMTKLLNSLHHRDSSRLAALRMTYSRRHLESLPILPESAEGTLSETH
jgi:hypothetical protein